jgi:hypothetical protein
MASKLSILACRICGKIQSEPPWGEDGKCPTYDYCDCCGVEFGYQDCTPAAARSFRKQWISTGAKWRVPEKEPTNWSLPRQMEKIPKDYQ